MRKGIIIATILLMSTICYSQQKLVVSIPNMANYATQYSLDTTRAGLLSLMANFSVDDTLIISHNDTLTYITKDTMYSVQKDTTYNFSVDTIFLSSAVPKGTISMWSGSVDSIPAHWQLCDGTNGTPDLRGKFIKGYLQPIGTIGGDSSRTLSHSGTAVSAHTGTAVADHASKNTGSASAGSTQRGSTSSTLTLAAHTHSISAYTHTVTQPSNHTVTQPNGHSFSVEPEYYVLAFIMKMDNTTFGSGESSYEPDTLGLLATKNDLNTRIPYSGIGTDVPSQYAVDTAKANIYADIATTRNMIPTDYIANGDIVEIDSNKTRKFISVDAMPPVTISNFPSVLNVANDSTKERKNIIVDNIKDIGDSSKLSRRAVIIDAMPPVTVGNFPTVDTTAIGYQNRLLEITNAGTFGFICDTISTTNRNLLTFADRDTTKQLLIDNIIIQTDTTTIGYIFTVKRLAATAYTKTLLRNERLVGRVTVSLNFVGSPIILKSQEHLYIQKITNYGDSRAKTWVTLKYRVR